MPLRRDNNIAPKIILQAECSQVLDNLLHCECDRVVVRVYLFVVTICPGPFPSLYIVEYGAAISESQNIGGTFFAWFLA